MIEIVEEGTGTPKYLVIETGVEPYVAQDLHEVLENVLDYEKANIFLLTPQVGLVPVHVDNTDGDDAMDWEVTVQDGDQSILVERMEYDPETADPRGLASHTVRVHGWPDSSS